MEGIVNKNYTMLTANITKAERDKAKKIAKSKGMSFGGFIGSLIKDEITKNDFSAGKLKSD